MSQQPQNKEQQNQNQPQNQQQGQYYQGQGQGQAFQASNQPITNQYQQYQQGQQGQTNQGQQNQWQQGQQSQYSQGLQNQNQNYQKEQGQQGQQGQQQQWQPQGLQGQGYQTQPNQQGQQYQPTQPSQQLNQQQPQVQQQPQTQKSQALQQNQQNQSQPLPSQQGQNSQWQQGQTQNNQTQTFQQQPTQQGQYYQGQQGQPQNQLQGQQAQTNQPATQAYQNQWQQGQQYQQNNPQVNNQQQSSTQSQKTQSPQVQQAPQSTNQFNQQHQPSTLQNQPLQTNQQPNQQGLQPQGLNNQFGLQNPQNQSGIQAQGQNNQFGLQNPQNQSGIQGQNNQFGLQNPQNQSGIQGQNNQFGLQNPQNQPGLQAQGQNNQFGLQNPQNQSGLQAQGQFNQFGLQNPQNQQGQPLNNTNQPPANQNNPSTPQKSPQKKDQKKKKGQKQATSEKDSKKKAQTDKKAQKKTQGDKKGEKKTEQAPLQSGIVEEIPKNMNSNEIIAFMKKKPYTQKIGNVQFTYSFFSKKNATFVGSHDRFLYLKGYQSISYAREFNPKTVLPFTEEAQIPKAKVTFPLTQIDKYSNDQEKLIIQFSGAKKVKWQFACPSKDCALKWKKKIETVKKTLDDFKTSGANNFDEFIRLRQANSLQQHINQQNNTNNFLSTPYNPNLNFQSPNKSQLSNSTYQSNGNQNYNQYSPQQQQQQNLNRPTSVLYQGPQAAKINNFIEGNSPQPRSYLNRSMSKIPWEGKEDIKNDIRKIKRNWIDQLLGGEEEVELVIEFKNYVQRIAEVIVNELSVPQESKMYPNQEFSREYASYVLDDIYLEVYFQVEDNPSIKNQRYKSAVNEFKNFEYLLGVTKNEGILKVPFMTLFEYKGFLGMAKSKVGDGRGFKNKEFYELINRRQFEDITRISAETLLNETKCKIVSYDRKNNTGPRLTSQTTRVYFVERLAEFLPYSDKDFGQEKILRREFVSDDQFEDLVFRDRIRVIKNDKINSLIDKKIGEFVADLQNEVNYFTNSQELTELIHLYGLNVHHLGAIFKKTRLSWLKRIFQAEIAARCLKNVYRQDLQNSILQTYNHNPQERQEDRERNRVVSFLNVIFGNTEPTFRLWRNINTTAIDKYRTKIWDNQFTDVNTGYLLQAIQIHFKISLTESVSERKFFKSMSSFGPRDFIQFNFDATIYNLGFTNTFELIYESFEDENIESFQTIGEILTKETSTHIPYLELLKNHPIHDKISQFFLNFISPEENSELYNKIESKYLPHKFLYESKFAQIKWFLKNNKSDKINKAASYIEEHARKWLGETHPLFTQLNRMLAEYFSEMQIYYSKALKYATTSLQMQQALFEGDSEPLWRDYYLIGKIHYFNSRFEEALTYLTKAKGLVKVENLTQFEVYGDLCLMLAKGYFNAKYYKESYSIVRDLYKTIREERDERSLVNIVEAVTLIKQLLEINQEHESYYKFVESDFSAIVYAFADYPALMNQSIKMITIPYLKNVILKNSKNKVRLLSIIEEISKIKQSPNSYNSYIKAKISEGTFPKSYLHCLKEIDSVIDEILANQMIERWKSFNNLANQSILDKIGNSQINRGFDFLANMTALFNLLGKEVLEELFIMEK